MHDFRTIQDHDAPHTTSDLLFKGAVQDHAASVYTGLIKIRKHANGTVAFQTNRNLTLSEGAWAESVPNLDIGTNDVKCSHASTVGPIDEEQRFYLESRGIDPRSPNGSSCSASSTRCSAAAGRRHRRRAAGRVSSNKLDLGAIAGVVAVGASGMTVVCAFDELGTARRAASRSTASRSPSCASTTTCTRSATCAATPTSRCASGEVWCDEREIECPKHGSTFSLITGEPITLPATQPVPVIMQRRRRRRSSSNSAQNAWTMSDAAKSRTCARSVGGKEILQGHRPRRQLR